MMDLVMVEQAILMLELVELGDNSDVLLIWYVPSLVLITMLTGQNEHAAELRRLRSKEASAGKASGTVFVKGKLVVP
jgi:hypothetical protein